MTVNNFTTYDALSKAAADFIIERIKKNPKIVLGLPTGSTPLGMYKCLIEANKNGLDFSGITTFNLDEYSPIKRTEETSYYKFMHDNFFDHVNIKSENINIFNGECANPDDECKAYEEKITAAGGIDVMVLGIGPNGHIGFNEPNECLSAVSHKITLTPETREANKRFFNSLDEVPSYAMTMGMGTIMKCRSIIMLASGESKKQAYQEMLQNKITTKNPSTFLNLHSDITVFSDIL